MRTLLLSSVLALALSATMAADASAGRGPIYPWCAFYSGDGVDECMYSTVAQCRASVSGVGGFCYQNLRYVDVPPPRKPRAKRQPRD